MLPSGRQSATRPDLAVVDPFIVPRRANWNFGPMPAFHLTGFYLEDKAFDPVRVHVQDPQTGKAIAVDVIGVLSGHDAGAHGGHLDVAVLARPGVRRPRCSDHVFPHGAGRASIPRPRRSRSNRRSSPTACEADSLQKLLDDVVSGSLTFDRLIMGFMGLGLIVGVAALGVISARSVVERRQQIGVLRAIGFRKRMVQACFLLESSFIALTSIFIGTALGRGRRPQHHQRLAQNAELGRNGIRRALADVRRRLPRRLRGRPRHDVSAGAPRLAGLSRRGAAVSMSSPSDSVGLPAREMPATAAWTES